MSQNELLKPFFIIRYILIAYNLVSLHRNIKGIYIMIYNINDLNISNEISSLKSACFILQEACLSKDRDQINRAYNYATGLPIIGLRQRIQFETQRLFYSISPNISVYAVAIDNVDPQQLELNINGCFNALKVEIELRELYRNNNSYAQRQLSNESTLSIRQM